MSIKRWALEFWYGKEVSLRKELIDDILCGKKEMFVVRDTKGCDCGIVFVGDCDQSARQAQAITDALNRLDSETVDARV